MLWVHPDKVSVSKKLCSAHGGAGKALVLKHTALSKAQQNQHLPATETSFSVGEQGILTTVLL